MSSRRRAFVPPCMHACTHYFPAHASTTYKLYVVLFLKFHSPSAGGNGRGPAGDDLNREVWLFLVSASPTWQLQGSIGVNWSMSGAHMWGEPLCASLTQLFFYPLPRLHRLMNELNYFAFLLIRSYCMFEVGNSSLSLLRTSSCIPSCSILGSVRRNANMYLSWFLSQVSLFRSASPKKNKIKKNTIRSGEKQLGSSGAWPGPLSPRASVSVRQDSQAAHVSNLIFDACQAPPRQRRH